MNKWIYFKLSLKKKYSETLNFEFENVSIFNFIECIQSKWYLDKAKTLKSPEQIEKLGRLLNFLDQDEYHDRIDYLSDPVQVNFLYTV